MYWILRNWLDFFFFREILHYTQRAWKLTRMRPDTFLLIASRRSLHSFSAKFLFIVATRSQDHRTITMMTDNRMTYPSANPAISNTYLRNVTFVLVISNCHLISRSLILFWKFSKVIWADVKYGMYLRLSYHLRHYVGALLHFA